MGVLDTFRNSSAWHTQYDLPVCPGLNNPWIYGAYALKLMHLNDLDYSDEKSILAKFKNFADGCRIEPGLFNRWPDGGGGNTSHDELMGMAYISRSLAKEIVSYLIEHDGIYNNKPGDPSKPLTAFLIGELPLGALADERFNLYRFPWLMPFLKASAGYGINFFSKALFAGHIVYDALCYNPVKSYDAGGRLRIWIMMETMSQYTICDLAFKYWEKKMHKAQCFLNDCFATEPSEHPVFKDSASKNFY